MSLFTSAKWQQCALFAALLIAGCGSTSIGSDTGRVVYNGEVGSTEAAWFLASNCINGWSDDDTEYCTILDIDGGTPPSSSWGNWYRLLAGEHHIKLRSVLDGPVEIIEMSFVAQLGHKYAVLARSRAFPQWRFFVYDDTGGAVVAHVGDMQ